MMPRTHDKLAGQTMTGMAARFDDPPQAPRLYRVVADRIRHIIRHELLPAGARLPSEREMSATLKVSRQSIREALIELEWCGEIEVRNGSGAYVTEKAGADIGLAGTCPRPLDVLEARRLIEPEVAAHAARVATDHAIDTILGAAIGTERGHAKYSGQPQADRDFHLAIALATGNSVLYGVLAHLWGQSGTPYDHAGAARSDWATLADRRAVASAIATRDPSAARRAMRSHLDRLAHSLSQCPPGFAENNRPKTQAE